MLWHVLALTTRATQLHSTTHLTEVLENILKIIKKLHCCEGGGRADPSVNANFPKETLSSVSRQESL